MKNKFNLKPLARTLLQALWLTFLVFLLPGWNSRSPLTAQSEATTSAEPTETAPAATDLPEPTKASTPATPEPPPTKDAGGIGIASGHWEYITETFEEPVFPAPGWSVQDLSNDGFQRYWDDDNYRARLGAWSAWPARGGTHGLNPVSGNDHYFNNMNTRMIYGPFDLSDASRADTDFYLWRELEACCDFLDFEISHDGVTFQKLTRWTTTATAWEFKDIYYDSYVGDSSVFIAWRFFSNSSVTYQGPWVDDVHVWKFVPDPATATPTRTPTRTAIPTMTRTPTRTPSRTPMRTPTPWPGKVYLPWLADSSLPIKIKSGIHLGNRGYGDWNANHLTRLQGTTQGARPKAVVVLSNQLYILDRPATPPCKIAQARVKATELYTYLTNAIQNGTTVIIRIEPSPGNFTDYASLGDSHTLLSGTTPAGGDYCNDPIPNDNKDTADDYYRAIDDIAIEMNEIYKLNVIQKGWPASSFFFESANEPNKQWFADQYAINPLLDPYIDNQTAWQAMDSYFSALYDNAKSLNSNLQILTPSMAQGANAEKWSFQSCDLTALIVNGDPTASAGYDWMQQTYTTKNDGYSWHNYWRQSKEFWSSNLCPSSDTKPSSDHVFQYFPAWLQTEITSSTKPAFITEADLLSPCPPAQSNITNKDAQADTTQESIWRFFSEERGADFVIAWLLTESPHFGTTCASPSGVTWPSEIAWHEAYQENGTERMWFPLWWLRQE